MGTLVGELTGSGLDGGLELGLVHRLLGGLVLRRGDDDLLLLDLVKGVRLKGELAGVLGEVGRLEARLNGLEVLALDHATLDSVHEEEEELAQVGVQG